MNSELMQAINTVIQKASLDGTLSETAVKEFLGTIEQNKRLKKEKIELTDKYSKLEEKHKEFLNSNSELSRQLNMFRKREDELKEREDKMTQLELEAQYERERVNDHKEMFNVVFKNPTIRTSIYKNGNKPDKNGYMQNFSENIDETRTED